ncbi:hypothetical protein A2962_04230 [Candidatus Woesebacteria bacterium RIFCSPLOWO2_01_FULL_39_61]|uniref:Uncharacterized protein n=1 Tax=Candidatus Woesebacteria bacterium RIFCSPHIGHO2_02_FULL_39_13 TaxID=1802505 RepID=A0A1F7YY79_9BACT|nr:MAG: hypothetical protein A2692_05205 [Candidatus Woesebacteria bacterium RIFCSPHIGHO2_01_FULL_39_95]OGM32170.1 MAG: hypothetical protein A3D01_02170 [Candidatus Woesebacteria bacterium RIFCSPHIGHO2_02_FULL_39_13]OGM36535.1 MAG: hypothetical protein A3E13_04265 [Candidatus Woesebacteria bacterium RIFCSPHIGHO2_12_FULL_40_20]OGM65960.1 MAG: hypothetical protein A2962_04230 [Candidatus Woesebacteria bacterium RIFCSPLOWO2_01_FULL_39_61]OGM71398.1 MAG: hypothetical protein A3H19_04500 [Candidatus
MITSLDFLGFIPLVSFLLFILGLGFYWLLAFFIIYHLIRFGIGTKPKKLSFIFLVGSIFLTLVVTVLFLNLNLYSLNKPLI